jgi:hypothetical protein
VHVIVRSKGEGVVILSEQTAQMLCLQLDELLKEQAISQESVFTWVDELCYIAFTPGPVSGAGIGIPEPIENDREGVRLLVLLLKSSFHKLLGKGSFKGEKSIQFLLNKFDELLVNGDKKTD